MIQQRKKSNSSKINLTISFIFHGLLILVVFFFAAREGLVGKKLKQLAVTMVPKEKKPEPAKEKPADPKPETAKTDQAPKMAVPQPPPPRPLPPGISHPRSRPPQRACRRSNSQTAQRQ